MSEDLTTTSDACSGCEVIQTRWDGYTHLAWLCPGVDETWQIDFHHFLALHILTERSMRSINLQSNDQNFVGILGIVAVWPSREAASKALWAALLHCLAEDS